MFNFIKASLKTWLVENEKNSNLGLVYLATKQAEHSNVSNVPLVFFFQK